MNEKKLLEDKNMRKNKSKVSFLMIAGICMFECGYSEIKEKKVGEPAWDF